MMVTKNNTITKFYSVGITNKLTNLKLIAYSLMYIAGNISTYMCGNISGYMCGNKLLLNGGLKW